MAFVAQWIDVHGTPASVAARQSQPYQVAAPAPAPAPRRKRRRQKKAKPPWSREGASKARQMAIDYFCRMHGPRLANGCEEWQGPVSQHGYGFFNIGTRKYSAHRFAYQYHHRVTLQPHQHVCHQCDNRKCISLEHLWIGTHQENMRDMIAKGRAGWQRKRREAALLAEVAAMDAPVQESAPHSPAS